MKALIVTNPFDGLSVGDRITDPARVKAVLAAGHEHDVVQADHTNEPEKEPNQ